ncbi:HAD family hydrolase [Pedomonas sp. V897]|uniref:HAD family hydrolase n=1 Tax=Pedomonas sp. V897 TaxID=3446482 RepID=UPI003EE2F63F
MPRPLLICDCDEVLLQFVGPFEAWLGRQGYALSFESFSFAGNIRHIETGAVPDKAAVWQLLFDFFEAELESAPALPGAPEALRAISEVADVVILTNIAEEHRERREKMLASIGMPYPVVSNRGSKGKAVKALAERCSGPWLFVDDLALHHESVANTAPDVHRLHFVSDPRLQALAPACPHAHARFDSWEKALPYALEALAR